MAFPKRLVALAFLAGALGACGDDDPVAPTAALSTAAVSALDTAIDDEYFAEAMYLRVLADFGNVLPFFNIVVAEQRHSASLRGVYERRGLVSPPSRWDLGTVPSFASVPAACAAAVEAEVANIAMYDRLLALDLPADLRTVLASNRAASVNKHQPAFLRCR